MAPAELAAGLRVARAITDELFGFVRTEALYDRPIAERHRLIFYVGHLEAFDRNLICSETLHPEYDRLFAAGIDPVDGDLPGDRRGDWPTLRDVRRYVRGARDVVNLAALSGMADPVLWHVAFEHRLMHAETLAYALNQMPLTRKKIPRLFHAGPARPRAGGVVEIPTGAATLGRRRDAGGFGWDNEHEEHRVTVPGFAIDRHNVTNRQYLRFVRAGGYQERSLWSDAAWDWIGREGIEHPRFWFRRDGAWWQRAMFAELPLPQSWPVYVSWAEAAAYARWKGLKLPTEAQWHRAALGTPEGDERRYPWGDDLPRPDHGNFGLRGWDPVPVGSRPAGDSAYGVADLTGNGWEWTSTPFSPFPGFEAQPFYPGYSANFFPNEGPNGVHYVLKGGSARTASCLLRRSFRNWFQPLYPYVHASFRCVDA